MSQSLKSQLNIRQNLKLTTWLQQSLKLLTLSQMELKNAVEQELLSNPLLENTEDSRLENTEDTPQDTEKWDSEDDPDSMSSTQIIEYPNYTRRSTNSGSNNFSQAPENFIPERETLKNHLEWQTQISPLSNKDKCLLLLLISHLDEKGYLSTSLEELAERESLSIDHLEQALFALQTMDPPGIGARDIKECLLIQTRCVKKHKEKLTFIIKNHLHNMERQNYKAIAQNCKKPLSEIQELCQIILSFNPSPAKNFSSQPVSYIVPDIYIYKSGNTYRIRLHQDSFPMLQISSNYKKIISTSEKHKKDIKKYFKERTNSGQYFIQSLKQRRDIITKVVTSIMKYQMDFFEQGAAGLKHIILKDIANDIGVHPSTVSRATSNKYVHTPRGVFPLKYFFTAAKTNVKGQVLSVAPIKAQIKDWISKEDPLHPLTDSALTEKICNHFQIKISRRVVSKYREDLRFLPSIKRKKYSAIS